MGHGLHCWQPLRGLVLCLPRLRSILQTLNAMFRFAPCRGLEMRNPNCMRSPGLHPLTERDFGWGFMRACLQTFATLRIQFQGLREDSTEPEFVK